MIIQGRIVIAGKLNTSNSNIATARFLPTGAPDNNYGFNGKYTFNIGGAASTITSMHIQNDYKIVLGGFNLDTAQANNFMITRIDTGGTIDLSFNTIGFVSQPVLAGNIDEEGNGMAVMNDGRIMMTGTIVFSSAVNEDIGVFRVKPVLVTGIQQPNNYTSIRPYPNPFTNELIVVSRFESAAQMSDISGRTVLNVQLVPGMNRVDTGHLPAGVYFINVEGEKGLKVVKN
ncbi:MAG: T9SS type A sorting domain-containing protein [Bacteroidetes bacterium]|nr:T9SS type A sorting domain-containing protein [Bacteroidota bacterium]